MDRFARLPVLAAAMAATMISMTGCQKLNARIELNKGVQAYKAGKPETAISHFQEATKDDPGLPTAKLYLATALSATAATARTPEEKLKISQQAIATYQEVLKDNPSDVNSLKGVAGLYFDTKKYPEAKEWQRKVLAADPKDAEAAYTIGVIDWIVAHDNAVKSLAGASINDDGIGNAKMPKNVCAEIKDKNTTLVEEGLKYLDLAVQNRPSYDDAMAYLNLTYRRKADIDCGDEAARKADVASADQWREKAMGTRKENEAKKDKGPGGITMDANGNMK